MNIAQVKQQFTIETVMRLMGAVETRANPDRSEIWFLSPLRDEKTASFKVDTKRGTWYDHGGIGEGGDMIKLVQRHLAGPEGLASISEALKWFRGNSGRVVAPEAKRRTTGHPDATGRVYKPQTPAPAPAAPKNRLLKEKRITNPALLHYVNERGIPPALCHLYAKEIHFQTEAGQKLFGIGMKNDAGGWEVRGAVGNLKAPVEGKAITTLCGRGHIDTLNFFEGQFDFYTFALLFSVADKENEAAIILHSAKMYQAGLDRLRNYERLKDVQTVRLWSQHDNTGQRLLDDYAKELHSNYDFQDMGPHYREHNGQEFSDLNAWWAEYRNGGKWPIFAPPKPQRPVYDRPEFDKIIMPIFRA